MRCPSFIFFITSKWIGRLLPLVLACGLSGQTPEPASKSPPLSPAAPTLDQLLQRPEPLVIAHRGYSGVAPENTLEAFTAAAQSHADLVEFDYYHSSDGIPVVFHDKTLDRTSNGTALFGPKTAITDRTAAELQKLDVGAWYSPRFAGTTLPTAEAAVRWIAKNAPPLIERKHGDAATCQRLLHQTGGINVSMVQAFDWQFLTELHRLEPTQVLGALGPPSLSPGADAKTLGKTLTQAWIPHVQATGSQVVVWNKDVAPDGIKAAHTAGLKVWIYTINDTTEATRLLNLGVNGLITDHPPLIWKTLALRGKK
jgi:glycerophosphoryl diester phosphodiesterase